jgi:cytochrome c biogenesis protein CcmG/thiol:disulfide interchange protein DsbE
LRRSNVAIGLAAVAIAIIVAVMATRFGTDPNEVASPLVGTPVASVELPYLEDPGTLNLADVGSDILVVNFWASWCLPCRAEHPVLVDTATRWESAGVRVIGIVYQDDVESASRFLDEFGRAYEVVTDPGGRAAISFGVFGVPETFIVGRDGKVAGVVRGEVSGPGLESALQRLVVDGSLSG